MDVGSDLLAALGPGFTIVRELDGGGRVYRFVVRDTATNADVTANVVSRDIAERISPKRFVREMKIAATLDDPRISPVLSAGVTPDGLPFYTAATPTGDTLRARIAQGSVPIDEATAMLRDVASALAVAHKRGIVHQELSPDRIVVTNRNASVAEFGFVKAVQAAALRTTMTAIDVGVAGYMAPEQVRGDDVDARADIYAWGVIAYELLAGEHPFASRTTDEELRTAHLTDPPVHLLLKETSVPPALANLVMRCLEKTPSARLASASGLVFALRDSQILTPFDNGVVKELPYWRRNKTTTIRIAGAVILFVLVLLQDKIAAILTPAVTRFNAPSLAGISERGGDGITTLAVLPFANPTQSRELEYLSDGLAEEISDALSQIPTARIIGHTSTYAFKSVVADASLIGPALHVDGVVTGSLQRSGKGLHVQVQLSSTRDGFAIWTETFEKATPFQIRERVTKGIVEAIFAGARSTQSVALAQKAGTANDDAYDDFLHGRYYLGLRVASGIETAIGYFKNAIAKDQRFARAFASLSEAYRALSTVQATTPDSSIARAMVAATNAIALDSSSADGHLALANVISMTFRYSDAEQHLARSLALQPGSAAVRRRHGENLTALGRLSEALAESRLAESLDTLSADAALAVASQLFTARKYFAAILQAHHVLSLDSTSVGASLLMGNAYLFAGAPDSALRILRDVARRAHGTTGVRGGVLLAAAAAGKWSVADSVQREIQADSARGLESDYDAVAAGVAYGNVSRALAAIERGEQRPGDLVRRAPSLGCDPVFDLLRGEPRYLALLERRTITMCPVSTPWPIKARRK